MNESPGSALALPVDDSKWRDFSEDIWNGTTRVRAAKRRLRVISTTAEYQAIARALFEERRLVTKAPDGEDVMLVDVEASVPGLGRSAAVGHSVYVENGFKVIEELENLIRSKNTHLESNNVGEESWQLLGNNSAVFFGSVFGKITKTATPTQRSFNVYAMFRQCIFEHGVHVMGTTFQDAISFIECVIHGSVNCRGVHWDESLVIMNSLFTSRVTLHAASGSGSLVIAESVFADKCAISIPSNIASADLQGSIFAGGFKIHSPKIAGESGSVVVVSHTAVLGFLDVGLHEVDAGVSFIDVKVDGRSLVAGDFRRHDVRQIRVSLLNVDEYISHPFKYFDIDDSKRKWNEFVEDAAEGDRIETEDKHVWMAVRDIGEITFLTKISVASLLVVPVLASMWPMIRAGLVGVEYVFAQMLDSVNAAADRLATTLAQAEPIGADTSDGVAAITRDLDQIRRSTETWSETVSELSASVHAMPISLALVFVAAVCATFSKAIYERHAPRVIREQTEDEFIRLRQDRFGEESPDRDDGLRRACDRMEAFGDFEPSYNPNLVHRHGQTVWIPAAKDVILFSDDDKPVGRDATRVPANERARIAIEEGARCEYRMLASTKVSHGVWALRLYKTALFIMIAVVLIQLVAVLNAAVPGLVPRAFWPR